MTNAAKKTTAVMEPVPAKARPVRVIRSNWGGRDKTGKYVDLPGG